MSSNDMSVYLTRGLEGRDQHIDLLSQLFEESQVVAVETANPALDLISFAQDCTQFWVISAVNATATQAEPQTDDVPLVTSANSLGLVHPPPSGNFAGSSLRSGDDTLNETATAGSSVQERFANYLDTVDGTNASNTSAAVQYDAVSGAESHVGAGYASEEIYQLSQEKNVAGFIYLLPSSAYPDALHFEEYNIGIMLHPQWRGRGIAERALYLALDLVFSKPHVHRVQAQLIDCYKNDKALTLFTRM